MLQELREHIVKARQRAQQCHDAALEAADQTLKRGLEELEQSWLDLAASFETLKTIENFLLDGAKEKGSSSEN